MLERQTATRTGTTTSYKFLLAFVLNQQNAQFNNVKKGNFRSLKDRDKEICDYNDNDLLLLKRWRQN